MYHVYILLSDKDPNKIYIGLTTDVERRVSEHNRAQSGYSKQYAPWNLESTIAFKDKLLAEKFETYLKSGSGFAFMKKRLLPNTHSGPTEKHK